MKNSSEVLSSIHMGIEALRLTEFAEKHLNKVLADMMKKPEN